MGKKIFSGVQPTGNLHLGNYLGAIKNFVTLNNDTENECIFCVVDLHAITVKQDSKELRNNIRETVATFIASGINPKKSIIFNQSQVSAHAEGAWILSCVARMGWLNRMTQFKEKAGKDKEKASASPVNFLSLLQIFSDQFTFVFNDVCLRYIHLLLTFLVNNVKHLVSSQVSILHCPHETFTN